MCRSVIRLVLLACLAVGVAAPADARVIRVKWDSPADGPGDDWSSAFQTVTAAIAASVAGDEIWVVGDAAHPYVENITLKDGVGLYGGFAGGETTRDERDWNTNVTILDGGDIEEEAVVTVSSGATITTVLNGFTIRNGTTGIYCLSSSPTITNNTIAGNGEGISCYTSSPTITNNTIAGNETGIYCYDLSPSITNNIVAFNTMGIFNWHCTPVLRSNCVFNPDGTNYRGLAAGASDITTDPKFVSATYGKLHIQPDSPCVDAGLDSVVGGGWKDMDGQARIQGPHVDIGADESDGTVWPEYVQVVVRVSPDGVDDTAHDGSSWVLAKRTVQAGIDLARAEGGDVWVAAGVYNESITLPAYVYLYGGFAGGESSRGERDWGVNSTALDGGGSDSVVTAPSGYHVSTIDGFVIRNGFHGIDCYRSSPTITNNTISGNDRIGIFCYSSFSSSPTITNNILAFNATGIRNDSTSGTPVLRSNCVFNPGGTNYDGLSAGTGDINVDPEFQSAAYGKLHIQPGSPCVDAGLDSVVGASWKDMDGQVRIQGPHVDIGADESDGTAWPEYVPVVVCVSPNGVDDAAHDGSTWALAKRTVQAGIDVAKAEGGDVWVAAGVYNESITLPAYVYVYSGFAGGESSRGERDWGMNSTVLDGGGSGNVATATGGHRVSAIDGFTIRNGQYGIHCYYSSPSITNNTIAGNGYCGIYCDFSSSPSITNNTISGNSSYGISCFDYSCPSITNNIVAFNTSGIYNYSGNPVLKNNCVFSTDGTNYVGLTAGTGDVSEDPLFADRAAGNLRLLPGSPCIDAGDDAGVPPWLTVDKDGNPRISGAHVDMGTYEFWPVPPAASIPEARGGKDGAQVSLTGVIVTAAWPDVLYVEQPDRACGIRVEKPRHGLNVGQSAAVAGVMGTTVDGERMITASSASRSAGQALPALGMTSRSLGGADSADYSAADGTGQQGVTGGAGLNNIGLLVKVSGKVTFVDPGGQFFTLWDGSAVKDADGHNGVRVWSPGLTLPAVGEFATVTGISSCCRSSSQIMPMLLVRSVADIQEQ